MGQVIDQQEVNALPLNGRNFTFLAQLGAGMQTPQADTRGNAASGAFSANGERPAQNNYLLDGIDNNSDNVDFLNGTNYVILPPIDAIQEFKVQTGDYSAELGRAAGAVLNATVKSGTNSLHGDVWEFFRNDKLDAADWFEDNSTTPIKGELSPQSVRRNGWRPDHQEQGLFLRRLRRQTPCAGYVVYQFRADLGRAKQQLPKPPGHPDPAGGSRQNRHSGPLHPTRHYPGSGHDPVRGCWSRRSGVAPDQQFRRRRLCARSVQQRVRTGDHDLYRRYLPRPQHASGQPHRSQRGEAAAALSGAECRRAPESTYQDSPALYEHSNEFDTRGDFNPNDKNQVFARFSYSDDPQFIPGPFAGVADGGAFQQGVQTAKSAQMVAAYTHVFNPNAVNQVRAGFAHLHTTRYGPVGSQMGIPAQYGIQDIPQVAENGGLPDFYIGNLTNLGSNNFLPSDEATATLQVTDDFTRIYGKHSFKMGVEYQHVKFSTLQPAWSRGAWDYNSNFTDIPNQGSTTGGMAQMLLPPVAAPATIGGNPNPNGFSYSGGSDSVYASNISKTYDEKMYFATYFEDDWKMTPKLTLNLGVRWDYFGPINEQNGGQANFVPIPLPAQGIGNPTFILPASGKDNRTLSTARHGQQLSRSGVLGPCQPSGGRWHHARRNRSSTGKDSCKRKRRTSLRVLAWTTRSPGSW